MNWTGIEALSQRRELDRDRCDEKSRRELDGYRGAFARGVNWTGIEALSKAA